MPPEVFHFLPIHLAMASGTGLAVLIFLATFVLEDAALVGAGLLVATGQLGWPAALAAAFLGIWAGDIGLYGFARVAGRNFFERLSLRRFFPGLEQSERWFAAHGNAILVSSRIIPGARLPTYLAAGFLHLPFNQFLTVTGLAALVWTLAILALTQWVGAALLVWLEAFHQGAWLWLALPAVFALLYGLKKGLSPNNVQWLAGIMARWKRWEFWPPWLFYPPVALYYGWLALKYRDFMLPTASNPGIFSGGLVGESKIVTLRELADTSPEFTAAAELVAGVTLVERLQSLQEICARRGIFHPFILKPDIGQRGAGVKLIRDETQAREYLQRVTQSVMVQKYAPGPYEVGIFYYRFPGENQGRIFALTEKIFPTVTGDGQATLAELIARDPRARLIAGKYLRRLGARQYEIPNAGEIVKLVEAGNHAQGCIFREGGHFLTPALAERMDAISQKLTGFFIGRYDIRFENEADLRAGTRFQIIELNGAASEATNIYDARTSLFTAYRTLFQQWELVFAIGAANRRRGHPPTRLPVVWKKWRETLRLTASYPIAD
jgi:membrane protein DedA with SNARE-associated domain